MSENLIFILFIIHILISAIYSLLILLKISHLRIEFILVIFLLPIAGLLAGIIIEFLNIFGLEGRTEVDLQKMTLGEDIYWKNIIGYKDDKDLIPLEEAIIINDMQVRRKMMLDTLYDDPMKYLDILLTARYNDDVETAHYATTTISKAQRDFQLEIQKYIVAIENNPEDINLLDELITLLGDYIESGLLEDYLLNRQRIIYGNLLDKKLILVGVDEGTLTRKLRNCIALKEYGEADVVSDTLIMNWPEKEQTWIETIRVCVEGKDREKLQETIKKIQQANVDWTNQGRQQIHQWVKV